MMATSEAELWETYRRARAMNYGPGQLALLENVIAHADAQGLSQLGFEARMEATLSAVHSGEPARGLVTFVWCLAEFDRDPESYRLSADPLLWQFRYTLRTVTSTPDISLQQTYALLDDMQRRWVQTGHSLQTVWSHRHRVARHVGDFTAAQEYYLKWCATPADNLSDCAGCDPTWKASWLVIQGDDEQAIAVAEPDPSGHRTCAKQPQRALTTLMVPYVRTGRLEQARDAHRRAYRLHRTDIADLEEIAEHIEFCARTGNEARALEIVERHLSWLDRAPSPWAAMMFAASSALALRRAQAVSATDLVLATPQDATELAGRLAAQATEIAARFDRRNGTERVGDQVRNILEAQPLIEYLPLSPTARRVSIATPSPVVTASSSPVATDSSSPAGTSATVTSPAVTEEWDQLVDAVADRTAHGDHATAADLRRPLAIAYRDAGRLVDAAEVAEEELAYRLRMDRTHAHEPPTAHPVRELLVTIYAAMWQPDEALAQVDAIIADCARAGDGRGIARGAERAGPLLRRFGRDDDAADRFLVAAGAYAQLGQGRRELRCRRRRARALLWAGRPEAARPALEEADALAARLTEQGEAGSALVWELARLERDGALVLWNAGEFDAAARRAQRAAEFATQAGRETAAKRAMRLHRQIVDSAKS